MYEEYFDYRREFKRFSCFFSGDYTVSSVKSAFNEVKIEDISYKGAKIFTAGPLCINTQIKIKTAGKHIDFLSLKGNIRWCKKVSKGWQSGIIFNKILPFEIKKVA